MKRLVIIGARGYGREVAELAKECAGYGEDFSVKGFLDGQADALDGLGDYPPILGTPEDYAFAHDDVFVVALGEPRYRRQYAEIALARGGVPYTLRHVTVRPGAHSQVGDGCLLHPGSRISVDCRIGDFVSIGCFSVIGHDACIGAFSHIGAFGFMGGGGVLGEGVTLHPRVSVLPHKRVGENAVVGAGSVCIRSVKPGSTVFGVPAKLIN